MDSALLEPAHALIDAGRLDLARPYIGRVADLYARCPERALYADFLRMDVLLKASDGDEAGARARLQKALDFATQQEAGLFRLSLAFSAWPVAIRMTWTAPSITSAGRFSPLGPLGMWAANLALRVV